MTRFRRVQGRARQRDVAPGDPFNRLGRFLGELRGHAAQGQGEVELAFRLFTVMICVDIEAFVQPLCHERTRM